MIIYIIIYNIYRFSPKREHRVSRQLTVISVLSIVYLVFVYS